MKQITLVDACEWQGLYIDGVCVAQGHSVSVNKLIELLPNTKIVKWDENNHPLEDYMPDNLSECFVQ